MLCYPELWFSEKHERKEQNRILYPRRSDPTPASDATRKAGADSLFCLGSSSPPILAKFLISYRSLSAIPGVVGSTIAPISFAFALPLLPLLRHPQPSSGNGESPASARPSSNSANDTIAQLPPVRLDPFRPISVHFRPFFKNSVFSSTFQISTPLSVWVLRFCGGYCCTLRRGESPSYFGV